MINKKLFLTKVFLSALLIIILSIALLVFNANRILKYELEKSLGKRFTVDSIDLRWGSVDAKKLRLSRPDGQEAVTSEGLQLKGDFIGLLTGKKIVSSLTLESPHLHIEIDRKGSMVPLFQTGEDRKDGKQKPIRNYLVRHAMARNGAIDYLDRKISTPPSLIALRDVELEMKTLPVPPEDLSTEFSVTATVPGRHTKGTVKAEGMLNLKTKDARSDLSIKNLDLTLLKPYFEKKGDVEVSRGTLSMDADIRIAASRLNTTGKIVLRDLEFESGKGSRFIGLPHFAVMNLLKDSNNEISLDFSLEGDLNNPKFIISESLVQRITLSLARILGLPIEIIGRSVLDLGREAFQRIFK